MTNLHTGIIFSFTIVRQTPVKPKNAFDQYVSAAVRKKRTARGATPYATARRSASTTARISTRRPPGVALHRCDRHRAERHLRRRGRRPSRFVAPGAAYRPRRNPLGQSRTHPLARTVRCLVRRRRAGRFGRNFRISESENIPTKRYIRQRREKPPSFLCPDESRKGYLDIDR
jgi:hypothetical protein